MINYLWIIFLIYQARSQDSGKFFWYFYKYKVKSSKFHQVAMHR